MNIVTRPWDRVSDSVKEAHEVLPLIELIPLAHRPFVDPLKRQIVLLISSPGTWSIIQHWAMPLVESGVKVLALSQGVASSLKKSGVPIHWQSPVASIKGLVKSFASESEILPGDPKNYIVVHPSSLGTQLKQSLFKLGTGLDIRNLPVYQSILPKSAFKQFQSYQERDVLNWFFYSGSAAKNFKKICPQGLQEKPNWTLYCVGETSYQELKMWGPQVKLISLVEASNKLEVKS